jgi:hypothetical protein
MDHTNPEYRNVIGYQHVPSYSVLRGELGTRNTLFRVKVHIPSYKTIRNTM